MKAGGIDDGCWTGWWKKNYMNQYKKVWEKGCFWKSIIPKEFVQECFKNGVNYINYIIHKVYYTISLANRVAETYRH